MLNESTSAANARRFAFGRNWSRYLATVNDASIQSAIDSLRDKLGTSDLSGRTFLDIGCGSGLFSLAALRLGASVTSFEFDAVSVATTAKLKLQRAPANDSWRIEQGSVLDLSYLRSLGCFDVVYSWGVLHHTGATWTAIENAASLVRPGGTVFIAIYNNQGRFSRWWLRTKRLYNWLPGYLRFLVRVPCIVRLRGLTSMR